MRSLVDDRDAEALSAKASALMQRGIQLAEQGQPHAVAAALVCFDRALDLRRRLLVDDVPLLKYNLAACWLNRGEALVKLGDAARIPAALDAYDEALELLHNLPLGEDARFPRRLAIAHQNRGLALLQQHEAGAHDAAIDAFTEALTILEHDCSAPIPDRPYLLAAVWINMANAWLSAPSEPSPALARLAAMRALFVIREWETSDANAADAGLQARHALCRAIASAGRIADGGSEWPAGHEDNDVHEATDLADAGLELVRLWEQRGVTSFRALAHDFLRFGAHVYARHQPQFLAEFLQEHLDPERSSPAYVDSVEMRAAVQAITGGS
jgi:tetratricopeptide (TPR) repeat protein